MDLALNNLQRLICRKTQTTDKIEILEIEMFLTIKRCTYIQTACLYLTELFEMELFLTLKLYLHQAELFNIERF